MRSELKKRALQYAVKMCGTIMNDFPPDRIGPNIGMFTYHHGVFLSGMEQVYHMTGERKYFQYIKGWVDSLVDEKGQLKPSDNVWCSLQTLDYRQAGVLLFSLYRETGDMRYKKVLDYLTESLKEYPVNSKGVFWHFAHTPNEVWLDGLYMASPLMAMYGDMFGKPEFFDLAAAQVIGMYENMRDEKGLLRHGWDEKKEAQWADKQTGLSPNVWGRAFGWFVLATVNILDYIPGNHRKRGQITAILKEMLDTVSRYQADDGRWYQVVDKGDKEGNWEENSCSCMFVYSLAKSIRKGYIGRRYYKNALKGFFGILDSMREENGRLILTDICEGTCIEAGSYEHYIGRNRIENDLHGGAFAMMCVEIAKLAGAGEETEDEISH